MSHVLGIDIGTSGVKVAAMDRKGRITYVLKTSYSLSYLDQSWVELDLRELWQKIISLLKQINKKINQAGGCIDGISLSCFCNASVFMDQDGNELYPGIMYMDQRSVKEAQWVKDIVGKDKLFEITKNRIEPGMFSVTTLLWMKKHCPDIYQRTYKWGHLSTYILKKLSGKFILDWTQASYTGIYDIVNYCWSDNLCQMLGVNPSILCEVIDPRETVGEYSYKDHDLDLGNIPIVAGGADTASSALTLGIQPNQMFESVGTSNVLTICTQEPQNVDIRFLTRCHIIKDQWLSHGAMSTPGITIRWFYNTFLKEENTSEILEKLPQQSNLGANGVYFLPYMHGERTPIWDINARGVFIGLHLSTSKADLLRAIFEGCAYGLKQINQIIEEKYKISPPAFVSIGGGAKNKVWTQIKADVLNKEIEIKEVSETAVYGACLLASIKAGYFSSLEEGREFIGTNATYAYVKPNGNNVVVYQKLYEVFCNLYPSVKDFFTKAASVRYNIVY